MVCLYECKKHGPHTGPECKECLVEAGRKVLKRIPVQVTSDTQFRVTVIEDDERSGFNAGAMFYPKGVYFHKGNCILVGSVPHDNVIRMEFNANKVKVEIVV